MMAGTEAAVQVQNSMVLIVDPAGWDPPLPRDAERIFATGTCIRVGTLMWADGPTTVRLIDAAEHEPGSPDMYKAWAQELITPSRRLVVIDVLANQILEHEMPATVLVEVWVNHPTEPDIIEIVLGERDDRAEIDTAQRSSS